MTSSDTTAQANPADLFNEEYFKSHCGPVPYSRESPVFVTFFAIIADYLVRTLGPRTVMDAGCAMGLLVEALRDRGVDAWGIDISPYAISQVRRDIRSYCSVGSLSEPLSGRYDLITCIEVLEHMPEPEAIRAIEHLTQASDAILFSSSPTDFTEPTHVNVHQPMWWLAQFQIVGFTPDLLFDCTCITPHAMLLRKTDQPLAYEVQRLFSDLPRVRNRALAAEERVRQLTAESLGFQQSAAMQSDQMNQLNKQLSSQIEQLASSENRAVSAEERLRQLTAEVQHLQQAIASSKTAETDLAVKQTNEMTQLNATVEQLSKQLQNQAEQLAVSQKEVQDMAELRVESQRMRDDLANANEAIRSLTARQGALASQFEAVSAELSRMGGLVGRCDQRATIFLQQVESSEAGLQELRRSTAEHSMRWERNLNSLKAASSNLENRCVHLASSVQSMEPRVTDSQSRIEELTRLYVNIHQQVSGLAAQVMEILGSRIWKTLVRAGGALLKVTGRRS
jgi:hypothetical protein